MFVQNNFFTLYAASLLVFANYISASTYDYIYKYYGIGSYSNYSTLGLIQNPNARFHPAGTIGLTWSNVDPYLRGSIMAYPFDWMEAAYQYTDVNNALYSLSQEFSGGQTYKDKGFDVKFRLLKESNFLPQVALGFRDIAGSGTFSAEYIVASKLLYSSNYIYDFSMGLGWGGLSYGNFTNPLTNISDTFSDRTRSGDTQGGEVDFGTFFSGNMGIFGGVEIFLPNTKGLRLKIEYDGIDYTQEGFPFGKESSKFAFEPVRQSQSRINYGFVYPINKSLQLKASFIKGNTFNFGFSFSGFWGKKEPFVKKKDSYKEIKNPDIVNQVTSSSDQLLYRGTLVELNKQGLYLQSATKSQDTMEVIYAHGKYNDSSRAIGRVARTLNVVAPQEINTFKIIDDNAGMLLSEVTIDRSEFNKYQKENLYELSSRSFKINSARSQDKTYFEYQPKGNYPAHFFRFSPVLRSQIGGPDGFYFGELSFGYSSEIKFTRNISLVTQGQIGLGNNFGDLKLASDSVLPHVRSDIVLYLKESEKYNLRRLQLNMFNNPLNDLYTKFTIGILEDMFAGAGGEILYRPFNKNYAIGAEVWSVQQRDYSMLFDLRDYKTVTGHLNFYYREPNTNILLSVKGGKYLAKDSGFTFDFSRGFPSGLRIGAFFSLTDISEAEFGEGSFDKGFYFHIPVEIFFDRFVKGTTGFGLKPLTRDGAAILMPSFNLYGVTYEGQKSLIDDDWSGLYD